MPSRKIAPLCRFPQFGPDWVLSKVYLCSAKWNLSLRACQRRPVVPQLVRLPLPRDGMNRLGLSLRLRHWLKAPLSAPKTLVCHRWASVYRAAFQGGIHHLCILHLVHPLHLLGHWNGHEECAEHVQAVPIQAFEQCESLSLKERTE